MAHLTRSIKVISGGRSISLVAGRRGNTPLLFSIRLGESRYSTVKSCTCTLKFHLPNGETSLIKIKEWITPLLTGSIRVLDRSPRVGWILLHRLRSGRWWFTLFHALQFILCQPSFCAVIRRLSRSCTSLPCDSGSARDIAPDSLSYLTLPQIAGLSTTLCSCHNFTACNTAEKHFMWVENGVQVRYICTLFELWPHPHFPFQFSIV